MQLKIPPRVWIMIDVTRFESSMIFGMACVMVEGAEIISSSNNCVSNSIVHKNASVIFGRQISNLVRKLFLRTGLNITSSIPALINCGTTSSWKMVSLHYVFRMLHTVLLPTSDVSPTMGICLPSRSLARS